MCTSYRGFLRDADANKELEGLDQHMADGGV